jgi:enediyne biosynthesis protein E4
MRSTTLYTILLAMAIILPVGVIGMDENSYYTLNDEKVPPTRAPSFTNVSEDAGLAGYRGDNLAWGDYNDDGYLDLLVRGPSSNYLFKNNGPPNWDFTDVSNDTGVNITRGYSQWADYNGDGNLDFYTAGNDDHLFRNNGAPNWDFTDVTATAGNPSDGVQSEGIAWGDFNRDGYPDIFTVGWRKPGDLQWPYAGEMDRLYKNNGDGTFTDVSIAAGLDPRTTSYAGMGVVWCDPNEDGWPDIYVSNYHLNPNQLWINDRDGTFTESALEYNLTGKETIYQGTKYNGHSNGAGWADFDNDQDMDLWVSHLAHKDDDTSGGRNRGYYCADSQLFENSGPAYFNFTDIRVQAGIPITPSGTVIQDPDSGNWMWKDEDYFGVAWGDMENDGDLDLWVPQVKTYSFWDNSFLWENDGDKTFTDSTDTSNLKVWSNTGGTWVDYDNDGDLDFCTEGTYPFRGPRELHLFRNPGNSNHWVEFDLEGAGGQYQTSIDAIGSKVVVKSGDLTLTRYVGGDVGGHGFQQPQRLHFGLGSRTTIDEIWVYWTSGRIQKLSGMNVDTLYSLSEPTTKEIIMTGSDSFELMEDEDFDVDVLISGGTVSNMFWDMDNDRSFETEVTNSQLSMNYSTPGWRWLRFRVKDNNAVYWDLEPIRVKVTNTPPTVTVEDQLELVEEEEYLIKPLVQDTKTDLSTMTYEWYVDDVLTTDLPEFTASFQEMGTYEITVKVIDDDGEESSDSIIIEVENSEPVPVITHSGNSSEGEKVYLYSQVLDSQLDIDEMEFRFHSGDGRSTNWMDSNWTQFVYPEDGDFRPAVEVKDRHGEEAIAYIDLTIYNIAPILISPIEFLTLEEDEEYQFEVQVGDVPADEDDLEIRWDLGDGTISKWTSSLRIKHSYEREGIYNVTVKVKDDDVESAPTSIEVTVTDPDPEMGIDDHVATEVFEESPIHLSGWMVDNPSDEDEIEHRWDLGDGNVTAWSDGDIVYSHSYLIEGTYVVKLELKDAEGDFFNVTQEVIVRNIKPETTLVSSKTTPDMDEEVTFSARDTEDTYNDLSIITYRWMIEGKTFYGPSQMKHIFRSTGTKTVTLEAFDGTDHSDKETLNLVIRNPPPVIYLDAPIKVAAGESFILDASGSQDTITDQPNLSYSFNMGDGSDMIISTNPVINYTYDVGGKFTIILTVLDSGTGSMMEQEIEVTELISVTPSKDDTGTIILIMVIALLMIIVISAMLAVLIIRNKRAAQQPPPPQYPPGRMSSMGGAPPRMPPQRQPPIVQPMPQQPVLPPPGSSVPPPPQQPY